MKKLNRFFLLLTVFAFAAYSCSDDEELAEVEQNEVLKAVITSYTNNTVIETYKNMADNAIVLMELIDGFGTGFSDSDMLAAANAWKDTREYWEKSEAFLFGPAAFNNLDPMLDSWPLDKDQLDQVLADLQSGEVDMNAAYVRNNLGASLRGFHAVEYLLFRDGEARNAASLNDAEYQYLQAVAQVLAEDCITLEAWWAGTDYITAQKVSILEDAEIEVGAAFGTEMINAGTAGSRYVSQNAVIEEMVQGAMDIADEVGNAKIADPVESGNVLDVESWYSWNSLTDFVNNIKSIENAYMSKLFSENSDTSLSDLVKEESPELDAEIKENIELAIAAIENIGHPFRNNLDNTVATDAATDACNELFDSLKEIKNLLN